MKNCIHQELAAGRWRDLSLCEQLGNIGSEVSRALSANKHGLSDRLNNALDRALELFDLTIADPKNRYRLKEICRAREVVCDYFFGENEYQSSGESLDRYFTAYGLASRR